MAAVGTEGLTVSRGRCVAPKVDGPSEGFKTEDPFHTGQIFAQDFPLPSSVPMLRSDMLSSVWLGDAEILQVCPVSQRSRGLAQHGSSAAGPHTQHHNTGAKRR